MMRLREGRRKMTNDIIALVIWGGFISVTCYGAFWFARKGDKVGQWVSLFMAFSGVLGLVRSL